MVSALAIDAATVPPLSVFSQLDGVPVATIYGQLDCLVERGHRDFSRLLPRAGGWPLARAVPRCRGPLGRRFRPGSLFIWRRLCSYAPKSAPEPGFVVHLSPVVQLRTEFHPVAPIPCPLVRGCPAAHRKRELRAKR
jgi:hypothetical protein